jgi:hypothetical protein
MKSEIMVIHNFDGENFIVKVSNNILRVFDADGNVVPYHADMFAKIRADFFLPPLEDDYGRPIEMSVCTSCHGKGSSSQHLGVIDSEEWDDDSFADYMAGMYDRRCGDCKGRGMSPVHLNHHVIEDGDDESGPCWCAACLADEADYRRMCAAEQRMGA